MQSNQNSLNKQHPSFVKSPEEFQTLLAQCPFMSIIQSKTNKNTIRKKTDAKSKNVPKKSNDTIISNNQCSMKSSENADKTNQSQENSCTQKETSVKISEINRTEDFIKQTNENPIQNPSDQFIQNTNYLNSLSNIKKSALFKQFNQLSIDEQNEENELRQKQLIKLSELIQSNPQKYGQLSYENIHEQLKHFYL
ncbi:unnamed protein product [Schistosoma turkestanicum]|nr:unnamed protein product [Schistosoma turkestanicum]